VYTVDDVQAKGYSPRALRFALIRGHYRQPLNFTWEGMKDATGALESLDDLVRRLRAAAAADGAEQDGGPELVREARETFEAGMNDDLNISRALPGLFQLRGQVLDGLLGPAAAAEALEFLEAANGVLGVLDLEERSLDDQVQALIDRRQAARASKDWAEADRIRDELLARDIVLEDTPEGVVWRQKG
jgi:cysteinyl-tRNA synthetase